MSPLPYSSGNDQAFIKPGPAGTVLTSNGPNVNPSYQSGAAAGVEVETANYQMLATDNTVLAQGPNSQAITLPPLSSGVTVGQKFKVIVTGQGLPVNVVAPTGMSINGVAKLALTTRYSALEIELTGNGNYVVTGAYLPATETIPVDKWFSLDNHPLPRVYPRATYERTFCYDFGIADIALQTKSIGPEMMAIYDSITGRRYPIATYDASGPAPMASLAVL